MVFRLDMLPANEGDALWLSYGSSASSLRHVLIDAGRASTAKVLEQKINALPAAKRRFELVVVSHVDRDHIEGMIKLLEDDFHGAEIGDFWFNGYEHLLQAAELEAAGAVMGEALSGHIVRLGLPWNVAFDSGPVCIEDAPIVHDLEGGLRLTLLSPTPTKLAALEPQWVKECERAGLVPGAAAEEEPLPPEIESLGGETIDELAGMPFRDDDTKPNGSSIAFLAEYEGKRILLAADAHCAVIETSLQHLQPTGRLKLNAFKVAHHGSKSNLSTALLDRVSCKRYLISTNGAYFNHPNKAAIARIIRHGGTRPTLLFNYLSEETEYWNDDALMAAEKYAVRYPTDPEGGVRITI